MNWVPVFAIEAYANASVLRIIRWQGGSGTAPAADLYLGATGYVASAAEALHFPPLSVLTESILYLEGPQGNQGIQGIKGDKGDKGDQGIKGDKGDEGSSPYDIAISRGFNGSVEQWLASLQGAIGPAGPQGLQGLRGLPGAQGPQGLTGPRGAAGRSLTLLGTVATTEELPTAPELGDAYFVGDRLFVRSANGWVNNGSFAGPTGPKGDTGNAGEPVDVRSTETALEWKRGNQNWQTLVPLEALKSKLEFSTLNQVIEGTSTTTAVSPEGLAQRLNRLSYNHSNRWTENSQFPVGRNYLFAGPITIEDSTIVVQGTLVIV